MVLVKDNHIAVAGGVAESIAAVSQYLKQNNLNIGVEVRKKFVKQCFTYLFSTWSLSMFQTLSGLNALYFLLHFASI